MQERARSRQFATSEVQISETETPLHRMETVYRRVIERMATADSGEGAFRGVIDGWFYALEQDVLADASVDAADRQFVVTTRQAKPLKTLMCTCVTAEVGLILWE
jgi:P-loop Domain of unknown function (DUF2791)